MYQAKILADSITRARHRLTTFEVTFPRFILAEFNTHRMLSRNAASSRAVPVKKRIEAVENDPFVPEMWGTNKPGMQAGDLLSQEQSDIARTVWQRAREVAIMSARQLERAGVHKQLANRLLEPFSWVTVVASATDWDNFFNLRCHPDAQPEFQKIACMMRDVYGAHTPQLAKGGQWHLPYIQPYEQDYNTPGVTGHRLALISAARCARVSYITHDGKRDASKDLELYDKLVTAGHLSPLEHPAQSQGAFPNESGNFTGWTQLRKLIPFEYNPLGHRQ